MVSTEENSVYIGFNWRGQEMKAVSMPIPEEINQTMDGIVFAAMICEVLSRDLARAVSAKGKEWMDMNRRRAMEVAKKMSAPQAGSAPQAEVQEAQDGRDSAG